MSKVIVDGSEPNGARGKVWRLTCDGVAVSVSVQPSLEAQRAAGEWQATIRVGEQPVGNRLGITKAAAFDAAAAQAKATSLGSTFVWNAVRSALEKEGAFLSR